MRVFSNPVVGHLWSLLCCLPIGVSLGENLLNPGPQEVGGLGEVGGEVDGEVGDLVVAVLGLDEVVEGLEDPRSGSQMTKTETTCFQLVSQIRTDLFPSLK